MNDSLIANHLGALAVRLADGMAATSPLSDSSRALISTLHYWGPMSATELAGIAGLSQPAATRALDRLRREGSVDWPDSGRTRPVSLTAAGRDRARDLMGRRDAFLQKSLAALTGEERAVLSPLLERMLAGLTGSEGEARHMCRFCDHVLCDGPACPVGECVRAMEGGPHDPA